MSITTLLQALLLISGALMFIVGSIGLVRFPDTYTRIHALTKADNLGLGLIILGLIPSTFSLALTLKLLFIWLLIMLAGALSGHLVAWEAQAQGVATRQPGEADKQTSQGCTDE
ncbi:cation:proton antiporter [Nitrincola sp. A-D6]|uniref:monovalent cation/H(+) antiporter subunit G n=1 Tax=Nitrincola sp. A-D6 TaxID=1545442 RepID=UPI00051FE671|nr:monovalent cation/H(+) antiporter subunit G [Nitrincola sp. A-D6]KGK41427.1 cation:proton antiporter [Nitrincola sp. A-D6]